MQQKIVEAGGHGAGSEKRTRHMRVSFHKLGGVMECEKTNKLTKTTAAFASVAFVWIWMGKSFLDASIVRPSVRPYVCPSVRPSNVFYLLHLHLSLIKFATSLQ